MCCPFLSYALDLISENECDLIDLIINCFLCSCFFSSECHRPAHMSGESVVAIASRDSRVRLIDMQSAQEKSIVLVGHAASVHCVYVQEDKKRVFTVSENHI